MLINVDITLSEDGAVAMNGGGGGRTVASSVVMRSGRHFASVTVVAGTDMFFGVIRPGWDVEAGASALVDGHCLIATADGTRCPGFSNWEGMQGAREQDDRIGMLLDLNQGSMIVWKNDVKLGVMQAEGLNGPFCWAAKTFERSARIQSAPAPPSPTEEERAAANEPM